MTNPTTKVETVNVVKPEECSSKIREVEMTTKQTRFEELQEKSEMMSRQEFDKQVVRAETAMPTQPVSSEVKEIQEIMNLDGKFDTEGRKKQKLNNLFKKRNKELEKAAEELTRDCKVNTCVVETNEALRSFKKSQVRLFDAVRTAYFDLKDDKKALSRYKILVDIDRSSINKIIAIVSNDTVMKNCSVLPVAWSVLYALTKLKSEQLMRAIEDNEISPQMTLSEVNELREKYAPTSDKKVDDSKATNEETKFIEPNTVYLDLAELKLSKKDEHQLRKMLITLDRKFNIKTTGMNLYVEEVRKVA